MKALAMDASSPLLVVGVQLDERVEASCLEVGVHHAEQLMPRLDALCQRLQRGPDAGWQLVVCGQGPGSFSGVRVALATAKGLSLALGVPFVLVPTLQAWAQTVEVTGTVLPVIDARRNSVYIQAFCCGQPHGPIHDLQLEQLGQHLASLPRPWHAVGPGAELLRGLVDQLHPVDGHGFMAQLLRLGSQKWKDEGGSQALAGPHYLRAAVPEAGSFVGVQPAPPTINAVFPSPPPARAR